MDQTWWTYDVHIVVAIEIGCPGVERVPGGKELITRGLKSSEGRKLTS